MFKSKFLSVFCSIVLVFQVIQTVELNSADNTSLNQQPHAPVNSDAANKKPRTICGPSGCWTSKL
jgi:hypothetical protein